MSLDEFIAYCDSDYSETNCSSTHHDSDCSDSTGYTPTVDPPFISRFESPTEPSSNLDALQLDIDNLRKENATLRQRVLQLDRTTLCAPSDPVCLPPLLLTPPTSTSLPKRRRRRRTKRKTSPTQPFEGSVHLTVRPHIFGLKPSSTPHSPHHLYSPRSCAVWIRVDDMKAYKANTPCITHGPIKWSNLMMETFPPFRPNHTSHCAPQFIPRARPLSLVQFGGGI